MMSNSDIDETLTSASFTPGSSEMLPKSFYDSLPISTVSSDRHYESAASEDEMTINSPSDNTSFHTAGSLESSITEVDLSDVEDQDSCDQMFQLPDGQVKLEVVDSYEPFLQEKPLLTDDSISRRLMKTNNDPPKIRKPSIDIPSESTPLILQNNIFSEEDSNKDDHCCIIL